ncbi:tyrosine-type recombinase/integrase [Streptomyces caniferus]|uniref:tyrosine-type recombinase/integrase n=1 Tax=Streptomyces caniferus TaxID=285557 RepID=UPI00381B1B43
MMQASIMTEQQLDELLDDETIPVAHRALWALLWEGEVRLVEALSLDVRDLDLDARTIRVDYAKHSALGAAAAPIGDRAATLLHRAADGRTEGPALHTDGRPIRRETAARRARSAGAASIHAFRSSGQAHRRPTRPSPS